MTLRLAVILSLLFSAESLAETCLVEVSDALKCGGTELATCTKEVTDEAECGLKKIKSASKCGTETVTDGAACGWDNFTSVAKCGAECVGSLGTKCSCRKPKSCKQPKSCKVAKTCDIEFECERPKTCFSRVPNCEAFPGAWKAELTAAFTANHGAEALKRFEKLKPPEVALVSTKLQELPATMAPYRVYVTKKLDKWGDALKDPKTYALMQRIVLKAAKKDLDKDLKKDLAELTALLRVKGWDPAEDKRPILLPSFPGFPRVRMMVDADDEDAEADLKGNEVAPVAKAAAPKKKKTKKSEPKMYEHTYAVTVNISIAPGAGGAASIGVTWDDEGNVKGLVSVGFSAGIQGRAEFDLTFSVAPGTLDDVPGMAIGVSGGAAYFAGAVAFVEWAIPGQYAIPTWGYGPTAGVGAGIAYTQGDSFTF
ncbi:MAG: hypothetical protein Q8L14_15050 [Myxococcales bacterium]|nr:hypothetical protein [Myxococcales bacterium]